MHRRSKTRLGLCAALLLAAFAASGCAGPQRPIFPVVHPRIVWPPPPDTPRIEYIGQLTGEASLDIRPTGIEVLHALVAGPKPTIGFSTPMSVAVRGERVYVADGQLGAVHVLDLAPRRYSIINSADGQPLQWPIDILALDDGTLAVADTRRRAIFLFDSAGRHVQTIGADVLQRPSSIAFDKQRNELWVLDAAAHQLLIFGRDGALHRRIGDRGNGPAQFNFPAGVTFGPNGPIVADSMNFRVQILDREGAATNIFGRKGDAAGDFSLPRDVAVDSDNHTYVLDSQFENIQIFDDNGRLLMAFGQEGRKPGEFYLPGGITIDAQNRIWVADTYNRRVQVFRYVRAGDEP